jgi:hypothetical protein
LEGHLDPELIQVATRISIYKVELN